MTQKVENGLPTQFKMVTPFLKTLSTFMRIYSSKLIGMDTQQLFNINHARK